MVMSGIDGLPRDKQPQDRHAMIRLIHAAVDRGVTFFDTAELYDSLTNEELLKLTRQEAPLRAPQS